MPKKPTKEEQSVIEIILQMSSKIDGLDTRFNSVDRRLDKQDGRLESLDKNMADHMDRTAEVEEENRINRADIKELKTFKAYVEGAIKGIGLAATIGSLIFGAVKAVLALITFFH
jgi:chromosome segregation ATPase